MVVYDFFTNTQIAPVAVLESVEIDTSTPDDLLAQDARVATHCGDTTAADYLAISAALRPYALGVHAFRKLTGNYIIHAVPFDATNIAAALTRVGFTIESQIDSIDRDSGEAYVIMEVSV